jgi:hypothetical protein
MEMEIDSEQRIGNNLEGVICGLFIGNTAVFN